MTWPIDRPTLGIKIEIPKNVMLQREHPDAARLVRESPGGYSGLGANERAIVDIAMKEVDEVYTPLVEAASAQGLPKSGHDGYVEFALAPRLEPAEIIEDVEMLHYLDLLRDGEKYPLRLTIGGIALNTSAAYLLGSTEIYGNIKPGRSPQNHAAVLLSKGGMKRRTADDLQLGSTKGIEFRTLEHTSVDQLEDILFVAKVGATAIMQNHSLWKSWRSQLKEHVQRIDLPVDVPWQDTDYSLWDQYAQPLRDVAWRGEALRIINQHVVALDDSQTAAFDTK